MVDDALTAGSAESDRASTSRDSTSANRVTRRNHRPDRPAARVPFGAPAIGAAGPDATAVVGGGPDHWSTVAAQCCDTDAEGEKGRTGRLDRERFQARVR